MRWVVSSLVLFVLVAVACGSPLGEGDQCNPNRNPPPAVQECGAGFVCTLPANCTQAVCCPADLATRPPGMVNAKCSACPAPDDAGTE